MMRLRIFFLLLITNMVFAVDWPVPFDNTSVFFGQFYKNNFSFLSTGMILFSEGAVNTAIPGEIIFKSDIDRSILPYYNNSLIILYNGDGLYSLYAGIDSVEEKNLLSEFSEVGTTHENNFYFEIYDSYKKNSVNPLLVLPKSFSGKRKKPVIKSFSLDKDGVKVFLLENKDNIIPLDTWEMKINAFYLIDAIKMPWYKLSVYLEGLEIISYERSSVSMLAGNLAITSTKPSDILFDSEGNFCIGEFRFLPGKQTLKVVIEDFDGNSFFKKYNLIVK